MCLECTAQWVHTCSICPGGPKRAWHSGLHVPSGSPNVRAGFGSRKQQSVRREAGGYCEPYTRAFTGSCACLAACRNSGGPPCTGRELRARGARLRISSAVGDYKPAKTPGATTLPPGSRATTGGRRHGPQRRAERVPGGLPAAAHLLFRKLLLLPSLELAVRTEVAMVAAEALCAATGLPEKGARLATARAMQR